MEVYRIMDPPPPEAVEVSTTGSSMGQPRSMAKLEGAMPKIFGRTPRSVDVPGRIMNNTPPELEHPSIRPSDLTFGRLEYDTGALEVTSLLDQPKQQLRVIDPGTRRRFKLFRITAPFGVTGEFYVTFSLKNKRFGDRYSNVKTIKVKVTRKRGLGPVTLLLGTAVLVGVGIAVNRKWRANEQQESRRSGSARD